MNDKLFLKAQQSSTLAIISVFKVTRSITLDYESLNVNLINRRNELVSTGYEMNASECNCSWYRTVRSISHAVIIKGSDPRNGLYDWVGADASTLSRRHTLKWSTRTDGGNFSNNNEIGKFKKAWTLRHSISFIFPFTMDVPSVPRVQYTEHESGEPESWKQGIVHDNQKPFLFRPKYAMVHWYF